MRRRLPVVVLFVVLISGIVTAQPCSVRSYFVSPDVDGVIETAIMQAINTAQQSLDVAMFSFTDDQLGDAVVTARRRGVSIRVILAAGQDSVWGGEYQKLVSAGIATVTARTSGLFHHRFAVIDGMLVITGSYNWSDSADKENYENVVLISCPAQTANNAVVGQFTREFNRLWEQLGGGDHEASVEPALEVAASPIIIIEVDRVGECIQLINISARMLDLAGWTLSDMEGSYTFPAETLVYPNDPYRVCSDTYNPTNDIQKLHLDDHHDEIFLSSPEGRIVDEVVW